MANTKKPGIKMSDFGWSWNTSVTLTAFLRLAKYFASMIKWEVFTDTWRNQCFLVKNNQAFLSFLQ